jgi:hypothetical protein
MSSLWRLFCAYLGWVISKTVLAVVVVVYWLQGWGVNNGGEEGHSVISVIDGLVH